MEIQHTTGVQTARVFHEQKARLHKVCSHIHGRFLVPAFFLQDGSTSILDGINSTCVSQERNMLVMAFEQQCIGLTKAHETQGEVLIQARTPVTEEGVRLFRAFVNI